MYNSRQVFEGETVIFEGEHSPTIYLIKSGQFKATKKIKDAERLLGFIQPGEFIGEMSYLTETAAHNCDVTAVVDSVVIEIKKENFYDVLSSNPIWMKALIKSLVSRIVALNKKI